MSKPLATFCVTAYNQERFVREAIEGAFAQTYSPLEILLSDDCSTDRTFEIMQEMAGAYRGPHIVRLNRNPRNLGTARHLGRQLELISAEFRVGSAGDDVSLPERTEKLMSAFREGGESVQCVSSNAQIIDANGRIQGQFMKADQGNHIDAAIPFFSTTRAASVLGATAAFRRRVFDLFGPLATGMVQEDLALAFRCRLLGSIMYLAEPLVLYRRHGANIYDFDSRSCEPTVGRARQRRSLAALHRQRMKDFGTAFRMQRLHKVEFFYYSAISCWIRILGISPDRLWSASLPAGASLGERLRERLFMLSRRVDRRLQSFVARCGHVADSSSS